MIPHQILHEGLGLYETNHPTNNYFVEKMENSSSTAQQRLHNSL